MALRRSLAASSYCCGSVSRQSLQERPHVLRRVELVCDRSTYGRCGQGRGTLPRIVSVPTVRSAALLKLRDGLASPRSYEHRQISWACTYRANEATLNMAVGPVCVPSD